VKLYIVRHAHAGEPGDPRYPDDGLRPLDDEGKRRFSAVARHLAKCGCQPDKIATSPLVRCRQTAEILAAATAGKPELIEMGELAPGVDLGTMLHWSNQQDVASLAWVGHMPDVSQIVAQLIGDSLASIRFSKGAVACLDFDGDIAIGQGELQWLVTAKALGF